MASTPESPAILPRGRETPSASGENAGRTSLFWLLQLGGWGLFGAGMFVAGLSVWPLSYTAVNKSSLTLFGFLASLLLRLVYRPLARRRVALAALATVVLPLSFAAAGAWMAAYHLVLAAFAASQRHHPELALRGFPDFTNTIYYFFVLIAWSVLYFGVQDYLELKNERARLARAESLAQEARLHALRLQLNPHFLFNTLNAISTLVAESRSAEANRMLSRLSDFLRLTLDRPTTLEIPLSEELDLLASYLDIEQIRFGQRLRIEISVTGQARDAFVPPLVLQPIVENAIRYAVLPREAGGLISIRASREEKTLLLAIDDDGPGLTGSGDPGELGKGLGLSNIRQRLAELYGSRAQLRLSRSDRGGLGVAIWLPFRSAAAGAA